MPLPSFYGSDESFRPWRVMHAAACGAGLGALATLFKMLAPLGIAGGLSGRPAGVLGIVAVALAFAALCAGAAVLRNFVARQLIWNESR
jgi:hypothetical protein